MQVSQAILNERVRYAESNFLATALINLTGVCATAWVFWGFVSHVYLFEWVVFFIGLTVIWLFIVRKFRGHSLNPEQINRLFSYIRLLGFTTGTAWAVGMFAFFSYGQLLEQFAFLCAVILLGVCTAIYFAHDFLAFLSTFLPFGLSAICIMGGQKPFALPLVLSIAMFIPTLIVFARYLSKMVSASLQLRFENIELIAELKIQKEVAESATLAKSRFMAAASHDLRQPIHAQGLFLEVLARSELSADQRQILMSIRSASTASAEMLDSLLDFSRIEAGVIEANVRSFHLQALLNKIENDLAPQANIKGIVYRLRETSIAVQSDPALVDLIIRNLTSNAIRYTDHGGVLVVCRKRGGCAVVEIWDTGIGIPASQHKEIFREFHQLGNPERDRRKGLGLGLAIASGLAQKLGHQLELKSVPGQGSVFRLILPLTNDRVLTQSDIDDTLSNAYKISARVLVIDDDESVRSAMVQLLNAWGCNCIAVESIKDALMTSQVLAPEIIISDYRLRELYNGAQAIDMIRKQCSYDIPALLITGDTAPERLREASASGIPLVHKPVSPALLFRRMTELLNESQYGFKYEQPEVHEISQ